MQKREIQNRLLSHLDDDALARLAPRLKHVKLQPQEVLYHAGDQISHIFFPETAVLCMLTIMSDGRTVESATVGNEGASWVSASYGTPTMPCQTTVATGGTAYRIAARHLQEEIQQNSLLDKMLTAYSHALLIGTLRTGACNALHSLSQRAARWMLITLDRGQTDDFFITHDFMASLLGSSRAGLTTVLGELEACGAIHTRRGRIELTDRAGLERKACECYEIIRETYDTLAGREEDISK